MERINDCYIDLVLILRVYFKGKRCELPYRKEFKSEFGFETEAAKGRSVAKRMFELLNSFL